MAKPQTTGAGHPDVDAALDEAFPADPPGKLVSPEEYDWLQRMKASNYQDVTAAPEERATLASALATVQAQIPEVLKAETAKIEKEGKKGYTYNFADLSAVTRVILPRLGAVGLAFVTMPTLVEGRLALVYKLLHVSGESLEGVYPLPQSGGPQDIGGAITYARRYVLCSVTGVAPSDDDDASQAQAAHKAAANAPAYLDLSSYEKELGLAILATPTREQRQAGGTQLMQQAFQQALEFRRCLDEHQAWRNSPDGPGAPTWGDLLAERIADEIEAADTADDCTFLWQLLGAHNMDLTHEGVRASARIKARAAAIKERNAKAYDTIVQQVTTAELDDLDAARDSISNALALGRLTQEQHHELCELHAERARRLERDGSTPGRAIPDAKELAR